MASVVIWKLIPNTFVTTSDSNSADVTSTTHTYVHQEFMDQDVPSIPGNYGHILRSRRRIWHAQSPHDDGVPRVLQLVSRV